MKRLRGQFSSSQHQLSRRVLRTQSHTTEPREFRYIECEACVEESKMGTKSGVFVREVERSIGENWLVRFGSKCWTRWFMDRGKVRTIQMLKVWRITSSITPCLPWAIKRVSIENYVLEFLESAVMLWASAGVAKPDCVSDVILPQYTCQRSIKCQSHKHELNLRISRTYPAGTKYKKP